MTNRAIASLVCPYVDSWGLNFEEEILAYADLEPANTLLTLRTRLSK
jgi:hypothetical protein